MLHKLRSVQILIWLFLLFLPHASVYGADSTSFDPTKVAVEAKSSGGVPVGTIISWPVATNPEDMDNWLECNGQNISPSVYPELFAVLGGKTPDLRGLFLRGHGGNSAELGAPQGHAMRDISSAGSISVGFGGYLTGSGIFKPVGSHGVVVIRGSWDGNWGSTAYGLDLSAAGVPVANEVRPDNQAGWGF